MEQRTDCILEATLADLDNHLEGNEGPINDGLEQLCELSKKLKRPVTCLVTINPNTSEVTSTE